MFRLSLMWSKIRQIVSYLVLRWEVWGAVLCNTIPPCGLFVILQTIAAMLYRYYYYQRNDSQTAYCMVAQEEVDPSIG